jgi:hypothetical protein
MARFAFRVEGIEPADDPAWRLADESVRKAFWRAVVGFTLEAKDRELASGLDRFGVPLIADRGLHPGPGADAVAHRAGLGGQPAPDPGQCTLAHPRPPDRAGDGRICRVLLDDGYRHRPPLGASPGVASRGGGERLPERDVIGLSPRSLDEVKSRADRWWANYKAGHPVFDHEGQIKLQVGHGRMGTIPLRGRLDIKNATLGVGATESTVEAAIKGGTFTGFRQLPARPRPTRVKVR